MTDYIKCEDAIEYSGNIGEALMKTGWFKKLTGSKYCDQSGYLKTGDIIQDEWCIDCKEDDKMKIKIDEYYCPKCKLFTNNVYRSYGHKRGCEGTGCEGTFYHHIECGTPVEEVKPIIECLVREYVEDKILKMYGERKDD